MSPRAFLLIVALAGANAPASAAQGTTSRVLGGVTDQSGAAVPGGRFGAGFGYFVGYTLSRSKDTRSFDPVFTLVSGTATFQSASSTPFDIHDRSLNYALSDFDRTHVFQGQWVFELPIGSGHHFASNASPALDALIGGWQLSGQLIVESGRPFTIYSGSNTLSNVVSTPATCNGCTGNEGAVHDEAGLVWYLNSAERVKFGIPAAGAFTNTGRNVFRGPRYSNLNLALSKRTRITRQQYLEFRVDATNVTNTPSFGFPTSVITDTTFGRIFNSVASAARQVQLGIKYLF